MILRKFQFTPTARNRRRATLGCAALFFLLVAVACQQDPVKEALDHVARGDQYLEQKKLPEAILEYKIAVAALDVSPIAHFKLAEALTKNDQLIEAFPEYLKAADLAPERDDMQIKAGNLLLIAGRFQEARKRARTVLERNPQSVPATILLGNSVAGLKDFDSAADLGRKAVELDPDRAGTYRNLAVLELMRGNAQAAEASFKRAIELEPKSVNAYLSLANLYSTTGNRATAEATIREALNVEPDSVAANNAMARLYAEWGRGREAEPFLKVAATHRDDINARLGLADYYLVMSRPSDAKRQLEEIIADAPVIAQVAASTRLAVIEFTAGNRAESFKLIDEAIAKEPKNPIPLAMKSRLLLSDNRVEEALAAANAAVNADQRSPEAHLALGRVRAVRRENEDARKAFNEALNLGAAGVVAQLELAKLHMNRGELDTAIDFALQGIKASPNSLDAQLMLVKGLAARADDDGQAEEALQTVIARYPRAPQVHNVAGAIALQKKKPAAARAAWEKALQLDPNNAEALGGLATLSMTANKPQEAWARVEARLKEAPNNPGLLLLGAKIRIVQRDTKQAEDLLRKAIAADASNLGAYTLLGWIYVSQHRIEEAVQQYTSMLRQEPSSVQVHTMMGLLAEAQKNPEAAITWYQKTLQINPRAAVAANNLAWIYVSRGTNLDSAMRLADVARGETPNQAEFHDTLGWVYYNMQQTAKALESLRRAVQLNSQDPVIRYHLGMAYVQEGTDPKARVELEAALKLNPRFEKADDARKVLASLVY